ncbi:MAG: cysteine--tRNA ligase [Robiginitomaculum sp.]
MKLKLYNSLKREKQDFIPQNPKRVTMYNCGPTVYSYAHIGNARAAVAADVLFRVLQHIYGEKHVVYARNITDVDDKINAVAIKQGVDISVITEKFTKIYNDDLAALGCLMPTMQPRATAHMDEMIAMIVTLLSDGFAYQADGHVFFDISKYDDYGKLSGNTLVQLRKGDRVDKDEYARKKNAVDFVLWKPSKKGEPEWQASFGNGRPGWHLECSAMIEKNLGETIDIHCGGQDLKFPHHENERAQSECVHGGKPLANYWVHNGFLQMDATKMSKSLGNVKLIHELLETWDGEVLRFALLSGKYREQLDWTDSLLKQSKATLDGWYRLLKECEISEHQEQESKVDDFALRAGLGEDLNTPLFLSRLSGIAEPNQQGEIYTGLEAANMIKTANFLGLLTQDPEEWFRGKGKNGGLTDAEIGALIEERAQVRAAKNWVRADEIRDIFTAENIVLEDGADKTSWRRGS